jgi:outer membrane protein assembly factor BamB
MYETNTTDDGGIGRLRQLEATALVATVLAFGLTALLVPASAATEANGVAATLLGTIGWTGAGIVAVVGEAALFAGWRRLSARGYPRAALGAGAGIAAVGVADVLVNLVVLSRVGLPETARLGEYGGVTAIVLTAAASVYLRAELRVLAAMFVYALWDVTSGLSGVEREKVAAGAFGVMLVLSSIGGVAGPLSSTERATAADPGVERWSTATGGSVVSSPTVTDETVYIGSNDGNLYALDRSDGTEKWSFSGSAVFRASPTISDGVVYASDQSNIYAIDAADGSEVWSVSTGSNNVRSLTVSDGTVYVAADYEGIYALDTADGSQEWKYSDGNSLTDATLADGSVYYGNTNNNLVAVDASDGSQRWSYTTGASVESAPTYSDGTVYVGSNDANLYAVDASGGSEQWSFSTGLDIKSAPTVADGTVYVGSNDDTLYAVDASSGSEEWSYAAGNNFESGPTYASGTIYIGNDDNNLYAVDASDGSEQWSYSTGDAVSSSPTVADGTVYVGSIDNSVYAVGTGHTDSSTGTRNLYQTLGHTVGVGAFGQTVSGTVTADGSGYEGASVTISNTSTGNTVGTATTNATGYYSVGGISSGQIKIEASASGYQTASTTKTVTDSPVTADLTMSGQLQGIVRDGDGNPITDANVTTGGGTSTTTNGSGGYDLALADGSYTVEASADGYQTQTQDVTVSGASSLGFSLSESGTFEREFQLGPSARQTHPPSLSTLHLYRFDRAVDFPLPGGTTFEAGPGTWTKVESTRFNSEGAAYARLQNGEPYRVDVVATSGPRQTRWESLGWRANASRPDPYGITVGSGDGATPTETSSSTSTTPTTTPTGGGGPTVDYPDLEPPSDPFDLDDDDDYYDEPDGSGGNVTAPSGGDGFGPRLAGECLMADGTSGVLVEFWDPDYQTTELEYNLSAGNNSYAGARTFDTPAGYATWCVGDGLTNNASDSTTDLTGNVTQNGTTTNFSDTLDQSAVFGGPIGGGGGGGEPSTGQQVVGIGLSAGAAYLLVRRFTEFRLTEALSSVASRLPIGGGGS